MTNTPKMNTPKKGKAKKAKQTMTKVNAPAAKGTRMNGSPSSFSVSPSSKKSCPGSICVKGHEYLNAVSATSVITGQNLVTVALNPLAFSGTRLGKYGEMFDKFLFKKFVLHYTSADPTTATGQYILAYDRDYADTTPAASIQGIREYFAMAGSKIANVWDDTSFNVPLADLQEFYYTNDTGYEGRIVFQGQIYLAMVSGTSIHGSVWIEYELDLYDPAIEAAPAFNLTFDDAHVTYTNGDDGFKTLPLDFSKQGSGVSVESASSGPLTGYKGVVLNPGTYLMQYILHDRLISIPVNDATVEFAAYIRTRDVVENGDPTSGTDIISDLFIVTGIYINVSQQTVDSIIVEFIIDIPKILGQIWMFSGITVVGGGIAVFTRVAINVIKLAVSNLLTSGQPLDHGSRTWGVARKGLPDTAAAKLARSKMQEGETGTLESKPTLVRKELDPVPGTRNTPNTFSSGFNPNFRVSSRQVGT